MPATAAAHAVLERLWRDAPLAPLPTGTWRGRHVGWLSTRGARHPLWRSLSTVMFVWTRFGLDLSATEPCWWFVAPGKLTGGEFTVTEGPSRWRPGATVLRLDYGAARAPAAIRSRLYDELKPLDDGRIIGLGGINAGPGDGDHFWMTFERM
jgi:hypothetical protein